MQIILAWNADGQLKECIAVTSVPLALSIRDALKGIWGGKNVVRIDRAIDEVPQHILGEIEAMENPSAKTGLVGGGRHG